jgi:hypothetical protein
MGAIRGLFIYSTSPEKRRLDGMGCSTTTTMPIVYKPKVIFFFFSERASSFKKVLGYYKEETKGGEKRYTVSAHVLNSSTFLQQRT